MAVPPTTYYDVLQVAPDASPAQIRAAWRRLASRYHPDKRSGHADAARAMAAINAAYEVLSDRERRAEHDLWIRRAAQPHPLPAAPEVVTEFRTFLRPVHSWSWYLLFGTIATVLATVGTTLYLGAAAQPRATATVQAAPAVSPR